MTNINSNTNMNETVNIESEKKKANPNSVAILQFIQQKVKEIKLQDLSIKHRTAVALVSKEYRKQNGTIRKMKNSNKCNKCKKCNKHK